MDFRNRTRSVSRILAYGSAYLKVHRAAEFYASLLNNQPMGFYSPATIVKDAHRHGVGCGRSAWRNRNGVARSSRMRACGWGFVS